MAASGRGIRGKGGEERGAGAGPPRRRAREAKGTGKPGTRRWRAGAGSPAVSGVAGEDRGARKRREAEGEGVSRAGGKREGASRPCARARRRGKGRAGAPGGGGAAAAGARGWRAPGG